MLNRHNEGKIPSLVTIYVRLASTNFVKKQIASDQCVNILFSFEYKYFGIVIEIEEIQSR